MSIWTILTLAVALSMDAFAVAVVCSAGQKSFGARQTFRLSFHFGLFQALMPIIGWSVGRSVSGLIATVDHWIAFGLLAFVGGHMIWEAFEKEGEVKEIRDTTKGASLIMLSLATSIDALAVGLSLALLDVTIWVPAGMIGMVTGSITMAGCQSGKVFRRSERIGRAAEIVGGVVLIGIGVKIVLTHISQ